MLNIDETLWFVSMFHAVWSDTIEQSVNSEATQKPLSVRVCFLSYWYSSSIRIGPTLVLY